MRFARALPYELHVNGHADVKKNTFEIVLANTGYQGAHFYVYSTNRTDGPWRYTVEAGKSLNESFDLTTTNGVYAFKVFGPNGFVRKFAGIRRGGGANGAGSSGDMATASPQSRKSRCNTMWRTAMCF